MVSAGAAAAVGGLGLSWGTCESEDVVARAVRLIVEHDLLVWLDGHCGA